MNAILAVPQSQRRKTRRAFTSCTRITRTRSSVTAVCWPHTGLDALDRIHKPERGWTVMNRATKLTIIEHGWHLVEEP